MSRRIILTTLMIGTLIGCSAWEDDENGATYTFSNHCGEALTVEVVGDGDPIEVADGETVVLQSLEQEPNATFVVSRPDGTDAVHVVPGTWTIALEGDQCPTDV